MAYASRIGSGNALALINDLTSDRAQSRELNWFSPTRSADAIHKPLAEYDSPWPPHRHACIPSRSDECRDSPLVVVIRLHAQSRVRWAVPGQPSALPKKKRKKENKMEMQTRDNGENGPFLAMLAMYFASPLDPPRVSQMAFPPHAV